MWSIGVVIFVLLTGKPPFEAKERDEMCERIMSGRYDVEALRKAGVLDKNCIDFLSKLLEVNPELRMTEYDAMSHPWLTGSDSDSIFSSNMELDDELAMFYQQATQQQHSHLEDDGDGSWQEVVPDSEDEEETFRRTKHEYSEDENGPPGDKQFKGDRISLNSNDQGQDVSFDFAAHETEGILCSNTATLCAFGQNSAQQGSYVLPFQEYGSEASIRTVTPHTIQVLSSQLSDLRDLGSQPSENNMDDAEAHIPSIQATTQMAQQLAPNLDPQSSVTLSHSQNPLSNQKAHHETDPIAAITPLDLQNNPTPSRDAFSQIVTDTLTSQNLMDSRTISSNTSITHEERTISQFGSSPLQSESALPLRARQRNPIAVVSTQEGILHYDNRGKHVPASCWGVLVPTADSLAHPKILCQGDVIIFGRNPKCTIVYTDIRVGKRHCVIKVTPPSPSPEGTSPSRPVPYVKCGARNTIRVSGVDLSHGGHLRVHSGTEIVLFQDNKLDERLAFKLYLRKSRRRQGGDESTEAEASSPSENGDSDALMSG